MMSSSVLDQYSPSLGAGPTFKAPSTGASLHTPSNSGIIASGLLA